MEARKNAFHRNFLKKPYRITRKTSPINQDPATTEAARTFVNDYNSTGETKNYEENKAAWAYNTDITPEHKEKMAIADTQLALWRNEMAEKVLMLS